MTNAWVLYFIAVFRKCIYNYDAFYDGFIFNMYKDVFEHSFSG